LREALQLTIEINLGATAISTGINASGLYGDHLRTLTGISLMTAPNLIEATDDCGGFVQLSCNPPRKKRHLEVEISRKLRQGEFL
jgi:aspartate ammonia-lyase